MRRREQLKAFKIKIWVFYEASGRHDFPWRKTKNAYKILISEVMLQQTQVARVLGKYPEFLKSFPDVEALAKAPLSEVLHVWQGMGYNRRALALKRLAEEVVTKHKGKIPRDRKELEALPGVGPYTAGAVRAFAFNEPEVFIETNIRRVFIYHFFTRPALSKIPKSGAEASDKKEVSDKDILPFIEATLDANRPREWYWALMDYGAHLPKIVQNNPNTKSKHYVKQSKFKGSLRELRGKILRILTEKGKSLVLIKKTCENDVRTKEALITLIKDKLIIYEKRKYKLA